MNSLKLYTLLNKNNKPNYKYAGIRYILVHKEKEPLIVSLYEDKNYPLGIYMQNNILDTDKYQFSFNSLDFLLANLFIFFSSSLGVSLKSIVLR